MQRGIPSREFIGGVPRKSLQRKPRSVDTPPQEPSHIDLRVIRKSDITSAKKYEWHDFLDDVGERNHALGRCKSLGNLAITFVSATEMNNMIRSRHPRDYASPKRRPKLFREIQRDINEFVHAQNRWEYESKVEAMAQEYDAIKSFSFASELEFDDDRFDDILLSDPCDVITEKIKELEVPYGAATLAVKGLDLYRRGADPSKGRGRFGLDLSLNESLYAERNGILCYLGGVEKMDTSIVTPDWDAHAIIFEPHAHLANIAIHHKVTIPERIAFMPPQTEMFESR